jgi:hypothetical protein
MNKSILMSTYNKAKAAARNGKLDITRTNKALGILMSKNSAARLEKYLTTTRTCSCPDHARTGKPCKHMIARMIEVRSQPAQPIKVEPKVYVCTNGDILMAEQKSNSYHCHFFRTESQFNDYSLLHPTMRFVKPTMVHGKREHNDVNHTQEYI